MADELRLSQLIVKLLKQTISVEEQRELETWKHASPANRLFFETRMRSGLVLAEARDILYSDAEAMHQAFDHFISQLQGVPEGKVSSFPRRFLVAASLLVLLAAGYLLWRAYPGLPQKEQRQLTTEAAALRPVEQGPLFVTPQGDSILLKNNGTGILFERDGWRVARQGGQHIVVSFIPKGDQKATSFSYRLHAPYGQTWDLSLAEGSEVHLNTGSSVYCSMETNGNTIYKRTIALQGEALFDISSNPQAPFMIRTIRGLTKVLGTSVNIRDYASEKVMTTTLLSGQVEVSTDGYTTTLHAGEQAITGNDPAALRVYKGVDTAQVVSWRAPYFTFTGRNIREIMREIAFYYGKEETIFQDDIDVKYPDILGGGYVTKEISLPDLLRNLTHKDLHYTINEKNIIVHK